MMQESMLDIFGANTPKTLCPCVTGSPGRSNSREENIDNPENIFTINHT